MTIPRSVLLALSALAVLTIGLVFGISFLAHMGIAHAQAAGPIVIAQPDPGGLLDLLLQGKYLPAVGAALVIFAGLARAGLARLSPWFATKAGGYVVGYTTAFALYVGTALQTGGAKQITLQLLMTALAMAWAAAGGWEHFRDAVLALRGTSSAAKATVTLVIVLVGGAGLSSSLNGCATAKALPPIVAHAVVDCTKQESGPLLTLTLDFASQVIGAVSSGTKIDWDGLETQAEHEGTAIGQCAFVQVWAKLHPVPAPTDPVPALTERIASAAVTPLERLRASAGGAQFKLVDGTVR